MNSPENEPFDGEAIVGEVPPSRFINFLSRFLQIEIERGEVPEDYPGFKTAQNGHSDVDTD